MSFLSGAFSSESQTRTTTTSQNSGQSEVGGAALSFNLVGGGKNSSVAPTVNITDGGAVAAGIGAANNAIDASKYGLDAALDFANTQGQRAQDTAFDSVKLAIDATQQAFSDALHLTQDSLSVITNSQTNALNAVQGLAKQTSSNESDRISKLATYALIAVAALVIIPKVFGK